MNTTKPSALSDSLQHARGLVRDVPDFPKKGILFRDVTPLLQDAAALKNVLAAMAEPWRGADGKPVVDVVAGMESRGFIFGTGLALALGTGFIAKKESCPFTPSPLATGLSTAPTSSRFISTPAGLANGCWSATT